VSGWCLEKETLADPARGPSHSSSTEIALIITFWYLQKPYLDATRPGAILGRKISQKCHNGRGGSAANPAGRANSSPPDTIAGFERVFSRHGREMKKCERVGRREKEGEDGKWEKRGKDGENGNGKE